MAKKISFDGTTSACREYVDPDTGEIKRECIKVDVSPKPCGCQAKQP